MKVYVKENSRVAKIASRIMKSGGIAIVFGRTIHLHNISKPELLRDERLLCHEIVHVHQWKKFGWIGFAFLYLLESYRKGYFKNRFEVEARNNEHNFNLLKGIEII